MLASEKLVLAKIEATEGVDAAPVIGTDLVRTIGATINPLVSDNDELNIDQPFGGNLPTRLRRKRSGYTLPFLGVPSGTEGEVPEGASLLRSCGLGEVITADTDVQYSPVMSDFESTSLYFNQSGILHKSLGFKGNLKIEANQGQDMLFTVTGEGSFAVPAAAAIGDPDFSAFGDPLEVNATNTTFTVAGIEFDLESFTFDAGLPQTFISRTKQTGLKTGKRKPFVNFTITAPDLATKNFLQTVANETDQAIKLVHGTVAGSIIEIDLFAAQLLEPEYGESEDDLMMSFRANAKPDATGNDWRLTYK